MRTLLVAIALGGCFGGVVGGGNSRPAVTPMLSELPGDANKRDAILDSANGTAGPEHRKGQTKKERKAETTAAFAAAIIGSMFSTTQNTTIGTSTMIEENSLVEKPQAHRPRGAGSGEGSGAGSGSSDEASPPPPEQPKAGELTPWVKLK